MNLPCLCEFFSMVLNAVDTMWFLRSALIVNVVRISNKTFLKWPNDVSTSALSVKVIEKNLTNATTTQQSNLVRLRFNRQGASTPLWEVESWSLPSTWLNPIPANPPFVVRTPQLHGGPTAEETNSFTLILLLAMKYTWKKVKPFLETTEKRKWTNEQVKKNMQRCHPQMRHF